MAKLNVTDEMRSFVKQNRENINMKSMNFATAINKTNAYVSKFDNGDFKTVTYDDLCIMIKAITNDEEKALGMVNEFLTEYILNHDSSIIYNDAGLLTFDDVYRQIDVPHELIEHLNEEVKNTNLSIQEIVDLINANIVLDKDTNENPKYEYNQYYLTDSNNDSEISISFIKLKTSYEEINDILSSQKVQSNYSIIRAIAFIIIQNQHKEIKNDQARYNLCEDIADQELEKYKFFNLMNKKKYDSAQNSISKAAEKFSTFPSNFNITIANLINCIDAFYQVDPLYTTLKINKLNRNLRQEPSLLFSALGNRFYSVTKLPLDKKKQLMTEIQDLIEKYSKIDLEEQEYNII